MEQRMRKKALGIAETYDPSDHACGDVRREAYDKMANKVFF